MGLSTEWTRKCEDDEDKQHTIQAIRGAGPVLEILKELLEDTLKTIDRPSEQAYTNSAWAYLQAHQNGRSQELTRIIRLLTLKD